MRGPMSEERYPTRTKWSHRSVAEVGGGEVAMRGRLLSVSSRSVGMWGCRENSRSPLCVIVIATLSRVWFVLARIDQLPFFFVGLL